MKKQRICEIKCPKPTKYLPNNFYTADDKELFRDVLTRNLVVDRNTVIWINKNPATK